MSDDGALGLAVGARAKAARLFPILVIPASGPMALTGSTATRMLAGQFTIPAGTIRGGEMFRLSAILSKEVAGTTGWSWNIRIGTVLVWTNTLAASARFVEIEGRLFLSSDRRWGFSRSTSTMGQATVTAGDLLYPASASTTATATPSARLRSTSVAFSSFDVAASASAETKIVDFDQDVLVQVTIGGAADIVEMTGFALEIIPSVGHVFAPKRVNAFGDSITEGTGATDVTVAWVNKLRLLRPGTPVTNHGLGGQTSAQIVDRLVTDPSNKECRVLMAMGTNDYSTAGATWFSSVKAATDRAIAYMRHSNWIWVGPSMRQGSVADDAGDTSLQYLVAQMTATYGAEHVCSMRSVIDNTTDLVDSVHPNTGGHTKMSVAIDAKMTAVGWAA